MASGFNHSSPYYTSASVLTQRGRSQTDSVLQAFSSSLEASGSTANENLAALEAHKSRLYELFALIEKEFDALHVENSALRSRIDVHVHGVEHPVGLQHNTNIERNVANADPTYTTYTPLHGSEAINPLSSGNANEQMDSCKLYSKKPTQAARQKWKGRLVTSLKSGSGANLLVDTSKHRFVQNFKGHMDGVWHVDSASIGLSMIVIASASADQTAKLWSAEDGKFFLNYTGHTGSVNSIAIRSNTGNQVNNDHLMVLTTSGDRSAHIWKANSASYVTSSTTCNHLVSDTNDYESMFSDRAPISESKAQEDSVDSGQSTGGAGGANNVQQPLIKLTGHTDVVVSGEWLFGGDQVITASWDRTANVYDAETGKIVNVLSGHDQELTHCNAHNSQKLVATASKDFTFRLWDFRESIQSVAVFQGHNDAVTSVVFTRMHHILSGSDDRTAKVWDLRNMRSPISAIRLNSPANRISVCEKHSLIAIPQDGRHISIYDLQGMRIARLPRTNGKCHHRMVCCTTWLSDHPTNNLISSGFDKQIIGWKVQVPVGK